MFEIYILKLKNDKWYIGRTTDAKRKINGIRAVPPVSSPEWVKMHELLQVIDIRSGGKAMHKSITLDYMARYGIDNVRGWAWTARVLNDTTRKNLTDMLDTYNLFMK